MQLSPTPALQGRGLLTRTVPAVVLLFQVTLVKKTTYKRVIPFFSPAEHSDGAYSTLRSLKAYLCAAVCQHTSLACRGENTAPHPGKQCLSKAGLAAMRIHCKMWNSFTLGRKLG